MICSFLVMSIVIDRDTTTSAYYQLSRFTYKLLRFFSRATLLRAFRKQKNKFTMKIEPVTCIWIFVCALNFWAARNVKRWSFWFLRPNLPQLGLFHPYFVCKCCFTAISITKIVIWDQSKPISLYFKIKKLKIRKSEMCKLHVYYS